MKKTIIMLCGAAFLYYNANAQVSAAIAGKKLQVVISDKMTTTVTSMGTDIEILSSNDQYVTYEIKSVAGKNIQLSETFDRAKGSMTVMGNEIPYDSDDSASIASATASFPQLTALFKDLHKTQDLAVVTGKTPDMTDIEKLSGLSAFAYALFNPFDKSATEGSKFSDSTKNDNGSKSVTDYVVSKISSGEITVTATTNSTINTTSQEAGMEVKINREVKNISTRIYDASTGLLKAGTTDSNINGTTTLATGQEIPVSTKGTTTVTVQ